MVDVDAKIAAVQSTDALVRACSRDERTRLCYMLDQACKTMVVSNTESFSFTNRADFEQICRPHKTSEDCTVCLQEYRCCTSGLLPVWLELSSVLLVRVDIL
jgi:hypothetical protein